MILFLDEEKLVNELSTINETQEDYINVTENNIDTLMQNEDDDDEYCNDDNFMFSV